MPVTSTEVRKTRKRPRPKWIAKITRFWSIPLVRIGFTVAVLLPLWILTSFTTAFFWSVFVVWAVWRLDSRIPAVGALALLVVIPILLGFTPYEALAEQVAVYVFFLLCITVGLQIIEMVTSNEARVASV